jgi:hypothetical protein
MIIGIDFDGTICEHKYPGIGKLLSKASEVINKIHELHRIIIITCRHTEQDINNMKMFLASNNIPYDLINENDPELISRMGDCRKIHADVYIDDHNLGGFSSWKDVDEMFEELGYYDSQKYQEDDNLLFSDDGMESAQ